MNASHLHKRIVQSSQKNLELLRLLKQKLHLQTNTILQRFQSNQQNEQHKFSLKHSYHELLSLSQETLQQNQAIERQIQVKSMELITFQSLKRQKQTQLKGKKEKFTQVKSELKQRKQIERKSQKIEAQNQMLQKKLKNLKQALASQEKARQQQKSDIILLKNQKLLVSAQIQKTQAQYFSSFSQRGRVTNELQRQLEESKNQIMDIKYRLMKEQQHTTKRNKTQALNDIRQMIRKHKQGLNQ